MMNIKLSPVFELLSEAVWSLDQRRCGIIWKAKQEQDGLVKLVCSSDSWYRFRKVAPVVSPHLEHIKCLLFLFFFTLQALHTNH